MMKKIGEFGLIEMCAQLDLSPAWVKKIEKYIELEGWGSGKRGKKSYYNSFQLDFFNKIANLRRLGFGLEDIKNIYDKEKDMFFLLSEFPCDSIPKLRGGVRFVPVYLITNLLCPGEGIEYNKIALDTDKGKAKQLETIYDEYREIIKKAMKRIKHNYRILGEEVVRIESVLK